MSQSVSIRVRSIILYVDFGRENGYTSQRSGNLMIFLLRQP